jgi:hypothetical protein
MCCIKVRGWLRREQAGVRPDWRREMRPWIEGLPDALDSRGLLAVAEGDAEVSQEDLARHLAAIQGVIQEVFTRLEPGIRSMWIGICNDCKKASQATETGEAVGIIWAKQEGPSPPDDPDNAGSYLGWCRRVLTNEAADRLRRKRARKEVPLGEGEDQFLARGKSERPRFKETGAAIRLEEVRCRDEAGFSEFRTDPLSEHDLAEMERWKRVIDRLIWPIWYLFKERIPQDRWEGPCWVGHPDHVGVRPLPSLECWWESNQQKRHRLLARDLGVSPLELTQRKRHSKNKLRRLEIFNPDAWENPAGGGFDSPEEGNPEGASS